MRGTKNAFTLAEVLITLGIIGVVAAMTMPTLMNSTQGAQYKAAYKKALSVLSQAVTLNMALDDWNFSDLATGDEGADYTLDKLFTDRTNIVRTEYKKAVANYELNGCTTAGEGASATTTCPNGVAAPGTSNVTLFFNDGIMFTYDASKAKECTEATVNTDANRTTGKACLGYIDVNGLKGPNKVVSDANNPTDIYPVMFYDQSVLPTTEAARAVLYGK